MLKFKRAVLYNDLFCIWAQIMASSKDWIVSFFMISCLSLLGKKRRNQFSVTLFMIESISKCYFVNDVSHQIRLFLHMGKISGNRLIVFCCCCFWFMKRWWYDKRAVISSIVFLMFISVQSSRSYNKVQLFARISL